MTSDERPQTSFSIDVRPETLERSGCSAILAGLIGIRVGGTAFPDETWWDCPVVILRWWCEAIRCLCLGLAKKGVCRFMEGPFWFELQASGGAAWRLRLIEDRGSRRCLLEAEVDSAQVIDEVRRTSDAVASKCRENGWVSDDIVRLERRRDELASR